MALEREVLSVGFFGKLTRNQRNGAREAQVEQRLEPQGKLISEVNSPLRIYLSTAFSFKEEEIGHMRYLIYQWMMRGEKPLSEVAEDLRRDLKIQWFTSIIEIDQETIQISISAA